MILDTESGDISNKPLFFIKLNASCSVFYNKKNDTIFFTTKRLKGRSLWYSVIYKIRESLNIAEMDSKSESNDVAEDNFNVVNLTEPSN
jgi:hypothetical protein